MEKILIANIFGIGDVLFTTPMISEIHKHFGDVKIDYVCNKRTKAILEENPEIDHIYVYEKDDYIALWKKNKKEFFKALYEYFDDVRKTRYDMIFDLTLSRQCGMFFMLAGIPERVGLDYKGRGRFLTRKKELTGFEQRHVVEYYLELLEYIGIKSSNNKMKVFVPERDKVWAKEYISRIGDKKDLLVAVIPGGGGSWGKSAFRKRLDPGKFAGIAKKISSDIASVAVLGDSSERELCGEVADLMGEKPFLVENDLDLKRYAAFLSLCDLVVCNDGGPLHMAVALDVKTVSMFGPVDEKVYGPYLSSGRHRIISMKDLDCRPCYNKFKLPECGYDVKCLGDIEVDKVVDACKELLAKG